MHELIARGAFEDNLGRIRGLLKARRDAMLAALEREQHGRAGAGPREAFVWADLPTDASELLERATAAGVTFVRGADFYPNGGSAVSPDSPS